ncbi:hypothetical protein [Rhizohabitans arisaemae]|uniref:hypothetical protein n=1 Tax=Rhizohabitans arisaemae TaxID=2720610 RepID=UPI0024B11AB5|nr:hypothetical protein [Rhizohabitans arisaemae]
MDTSTSISADPDLRHLADLLDIIPRPENQEWWELLAGKGKRDRQYCDDYVLPKLVYHLRVLRQDKPKCSDVAGLGKYLLMFFGDHDAPVLDLIERFTESLYLKNNVMGRLWAEDLVATSWRLFVRYSADGSWEEKWPADVLGWSEARRRRTPAA